MPWQAELDQATRWLDELALSGVIVELAAGSGWWSPLLAQKGELLITDEDEAALEQARRRLIAHGLMAHIHARDPLAPPDREADVVFAAFLMGASGDDAALRCQLAVVRRWLRPGGTFAFIEVGSRPSAPSTDGPGSGGLVVDGPGTGRPAVDGPRGPARAIPPGLLHEALTETGFEAVTLTSTAHALMMGTASAGSPDSPRSPATA